jgi:hypothetical protein
LGAFGGFFKKTWRANDIMIGRMDAVCQMLECLLTRVALARAGHLPNFTAANLTEYLPRLGDAEAGVLAGQINSYLRLATTASEADWSALIDALVSASHKTLLEQEWPTVVHCALEQEHAWGQYDSSDTPPDQPYDPKRLKWVRGKQRPDRVLVALAAKALAAGATPTFIPGQLAGHTFAEEIPEPILTELTLRGSLRAAKSFVASAPTDKAREILERNPVYTWVIGRIIPVLYDWTRMRRTKPDLVIVLNTIIPAVGITVFLLGVLFALLPGFNVPAKTWGTMIAAPLALAVLLFVLWRLFRKLF